MSNRILSPEIVAGNLRFQSNTFRPNAASFHELTKGQEPRAIYIGCSDSRVVPNLILDMAPGELFVTRNIGAIVPPPEDPASANTGAVLDYALGTLGVLDIIVCGHDLCGALAAIRAGKTPPGSHLERWLRKGAKSIEDVDLINESGSMPVERLVEEFVLAQMRNLAMYSAVQELGAKLKVHGTVYDPHSGLVRVFDPSDKKFHSLSYEHRHSFLPPEHGPRSEAIGPGALVAR